MKFLLTNDDGIDARGLIALERAVTEFGDAIVVAPDRHLSGCSHQTTVDRPLKLTQLSSDRYTVDGTPADCVRLGLLHVAPDVDFVLSGVNDGGNMGVDVFMSGTVAAAREAAWFRKPAIAFSQYRAPERLEVWDNASEMTSRVLHRLLSREATPSRYWNVNLPDVGGGESTSEMVFCGLDANPLPVKYENRNGEFHYRGVYRDRKRQPNSDVDVCFSGRIAISELSAGS